MPKRKSPFPEKPWQPDPVKWAQLLEPKKGEAVIHPTPTEPKGGWMLYRLDDLTDVKQ